MLKYVTKFAGNVSPCGSGFDKLKFWQQLQRVHLSLWFEERPTLNKMWTAQDWADGVNVFLEGYCNQATNFADFYAT